MHKIWRHSLAVVCLLLSGIIGSTVLVFNSLVTQGIENEPVLLEPPMKSAKVNVLILGTDEGLLPGGIRVQSRTDTMMVASFDPNTLEVKVMSLPRDSRVTIPGRANLDKINAAHAYGGVNLAVATVQNLLDIPIHYFVRVDKSGFRKVIDAIGGVDYFVEFDMDYEDPYQDLVIHLKKGQQKLNGDKAEQYVRFRGDGGDIDRIKRQQKFLLATVRTLLKPSNLLRVNQIIQIARNSVYTNIDSGDIVKYLPFIDKISDKSFTPFMAPGTDGWVNGGSYWLINKAELDVMLEEHFWDDLKGDPTTVTVSIQDASGKEIGENVASVLRRRGFTVLRVVTSVDPVEKTKITAEKDNDLAGQMVYRVLRQGELWSAKNGQQANVVITLGSDYSR